MPGNNLIKKQIVQLEVVLPGTSPSVVQQQASLWCNEVLIPAISRKLEKFADTEDIIRLENISIDWKTEGAPFDHLVAEKIAAEISTIIEARIASDQNRGQTVIITKERSVVELFIFFLQNGYLPWWGRASTISEFEEELESIPGNLSEMERASLKNLLVDPTVARRFVTQLAPAIFARMLNAIVKANEQKLHDFLMQVDQLSLLIKSKDWQYQFIILAKQQLIAAVMQETQEGSAMIAVVRSLVGIYQVPTEVVELHLEMQKILTVEEAVKILFDVNRQKKSSLDGGLTQANKSREQFPGKDQLRPKENRFDAGNDQLENREKYPGDVHSSTGAQPADKKKIFYRQQLLKTEGIYISNAGLVLLAPFLPRLFENLGIVQNGQFNSKDLALAMLQWLVTGDEHYAEYDLVLPKILCGMEPEENVIIIPGLPEIFKTEGEALLGSVIEHWSILQRTSVDGLRQSFLQREGKLGMNEEEWLLQVEQKPYDMLLEQLPWTISMIRLSWMPWILRTEWMG
ncbi:MAG: hypothetical protein H7Y01_15810 [Ferruginibacter sp.]|nr:hypothetical protein [Chitinophagaceae bacterium]